ncbi:hypothetical protein AB0I53_22130 [Saccharopolyspora sp. NPDC050389]|uniref:hypothetical protein n=1 Tax=Saccharopolyspora sp. NPDC050389 TaxID=3155516 RepID=UPI0033C3CBC7
MSVISAGLAAMAPRVAVHSACWRIIAALTLPALALVAAAAVLVPCATADTPAKNAVRSCCITVVGRPPQWRPDHPRTPSIRPVEWMRLLREDSVHSSDGTSRGTNCVHPTSIAQSWMVGCAESNSPENQASFLVVGLVSATKEDGRLEQRYAATDFGNASTWSGS